MLQVEPWRVGVDLESDETEDSYSIGCSLTHVEILRRDGAIVQVAESVPHFPYDLNRESLLYDLVTCLFSPII